MGFDSAWNSQFNEAFKPARIVYNAKSGKLSSAGSQSSRQSSSSSSSSRGGEQPIAHLYIDGNNGLHSLCNRINLEAKFSFKRSPEQKQLSRELALIEKEQNEQIATVNAAMQQAAIDAIKFNANFQKDQVRRKYRKVSGEQIQQALNEFEQQLASLQPNQRPSDYLYQLQQYGKQNNQAKNNYKNNQYKNKTNNDKTPITTTTTVATTPQSQQPTVYLRALACLAPSYSSQEIFSRMWFAYLEDQLYRFTPTKTLFISFDGPAQLSKLAQQKGNRNSTLVKDLQMLAAVLASPRSAHGYHFVSKLNFTSMTAMMRTLQEQTETWAYNISKSMNYLTVYVSGFNVAGEGEFKIFNHIVATLREPILAPALAPVAPTPSSSTVAPTPVVPVSIPELVPSKDVSATPLETSAAELKMSFAERLKAKQSAASTATSATPAAAANKTAMQMKIPKRSSNSSSASQPSIETATPATTKIEAKQEAKIETSPTQSDTIAIVTGDTDAIMCIFGTCARIPNMFVIADDYYFCKSTAFKILQEQFNTGGQLDRAALDITFLGTFYGNDAITRARDVPFPLLKHYKAYRNNDKRRPLIRFQKRIDYGAVQREKPLEKEQLKLLNSTALDEEIQATFYADDDADNSVAEPKIVSVPDFIVVYPPISAPNSSATQKSKLIGIDLTAFAKYVGINKRNYIEPLDLEACSEACKGLTAQLTFLQTCIDGLVADYMYDSKTIRYSMCDIVHLALHAHLLPKEFMEANNIIKGTGNNRYYYGLSERHYERVDHTINSGAYATVLLPNAACSYLVKPQVMDFVYEKKSLLKEFNAKIHKSIGVAAAAANVADNAENENENNNEEEENVVQMKDAIEEEEEATATVPKIEMNISTAIENFSKTSEFEQLQAVVAKQEFGFDDTNVFQYNEQTRRVIESKYVQRAKNVPQFEDFSYVYDPAAIEPLNVFSVEAKQHKFAPKQQQPQRKGQGQQKQQNQQQQQKQAKDSSSSNNDHKRARDGNELEREHERESHQQHQKPPHASASSASNGSSSKSSSAQQSKPQQQQQQQKGSRNASSSAPRK